MTRPLLNTTIADLEMAAERNRLDHAELALLEQELAHRSTQRAKQLKCKIANWQKALAPTKKVTDR